MKIPIEPESQLILSEISFSGLTSSTGNAGDTDWTEGPYHGYGDQTPMNDPWEDGHR